MCLLLPQDQMLYLLGQLLCVLAARVRLLLYTLALQLQLCPQPLLALLLGLLGLQLKLLCLPFQLICIADVLSGSPMLLVNCRLKLLCMGQLPGLLSLLLSFLPPLLPLLLHPLPLLALPPLLLLVLPLLG